MAGIPVYAMSKYGGIPGQRCALAMVSIRWQKVSRLFDISAFEIETGR